MKNQKLVNHQIFISQIQPPFYNREYPQDAAHFHSPSPIKIGPIHALISIKTQENRYPMIWSCFTQIGPLNYHQIHPNITWNYLYSTPSSSMKEFSFSFLLIKKKGIEREMEVEALPRLHCDQENEDEDNTWMWIGKCREVEMLTWMESKHKMDVMGKMDRSLGLDGVNLLYHGVTVSWISSRQGPIWNPLQKLKMHPG